MDDGYFAIAAGRKFNLAIQSDGIDPDSGRLVGWGFDFHDTMTDIPDGDDFIAVAAGVAHGLAIRSDGTLAAWGNDDGSIADYGQVTDTPLGNDFIAIAAGDYHNYALRADGSIVAWGRDNRGQCDVPDGIYSSIAAGGYHGLAIVPEPCTVLLLGIGGLLIRKRSS